MSIQRNRFILRAHGERPPAPAGAATVGEQERRRAFLNGVPETPSSSFTASTPVALSASRGAAATKPSTAAAMSTDSEEDYRISLPHSSIDDTVPSLRRSMPSLAAQGRHMSASQDFDNVSVYSRGRTPSALSTRSTYSTGGGLDTKQIKLYLKRHDSMQLRPASVQTIQQSAHEVNEASDSEESSAKVAGSVAKAIRSRFSVSSIDSAKEEKLISSIEHGRTSSVVLPRPPAPPKSPPTSEKSSSPTPSNLSVTTASTTSSAPQNGGGSSQWHSAVDLVAAAPSRGNSPPRRSSSQYGNRPKSHLVGEIVWQVDETVFCGGIEAVQNLNLLCRLNIEYIVDLSGQDEEPSSRPRIECPCLCAKRTAHSRMTMTIKIRDDTSEPNSGSSSPANNTEDFQRQDIIAYFEDLINLIRKARISGKCVLIHSLKGRNRAPAFVAAYLMHTQRCTRVQAIMKISEMVSKMRPGLCISDNLQRALMRWQSILGIRSAEGHLDAHTASKIFQVKRNAWC
ncbi:Protein W09H1.1 a [Aphelenchoides avenae]|nr:Protein W09H1.1 a [Aphelenchus avenae]